MRKPRDYDAELKALDDKARQLKDRRVRQYGELVIASEADALTPEQLAGALIAAKVADAPTKEAWRKAGATFFQRKRRGAADRAAAEPEGTLPLRNPASSTSA
jgi:hypothetical protein